MAGGRCARKGLCVCCAAVNRETHTQTQRKEEGTKTNQNFERAEGRVGWWGVRR